jgi:phosphoglycolate phosphatase-like HAD superfamily hydrolase
MPTNLSLLENAAGKLGKLLDDVVFVGDSTLDLIVTDEAAAPTGRGSSSLPPGTMEPH